MAFWKESMINRLSNLINRNRSAAKISQVLCSNYNPHNATGKGKAKEKEKTMVDVFLNFCWMITVKSTTCNVALGLASWIRVSQILQLT